jgi:hypothetical protein
VYELKALSREAVPAALGKAERYRLLNEPAEAESICLDVLAVDPENQPALVMMVLAITDQFATDVRGHVSRARDLLPRLHDEYSRLYYGALICERRARAHFSAGAGGMAADWFREALSLLGRAIEVRPAGNDDAILRWNACARTLNRLPEIDQIEPAHASITSE